MGYKLTMRGLEGETRQLHYDPKHSKLLCPDGNALTHPMFQVDNLPSFSGAPPLSPDHPGKKGFIQVLKIQMGFSCNYSCAYCSQAKFSDFVGGVLEDAKLFLDNLDKWFHPVNPETLRIELWGGEPFVYWAKLQYLVPALKDRFPKAKFVIITNGSLLDDEKVDWILLHDIDIGLSHDGPAQSKRHPEDILDDPEKCRLIRKLVRHGNIGFGSVLTRWNVSHAAVRNHIEEKLELPHGSIASSSEEILLPYDDDALMCVFQTEEEHKAALHVLFKEAADGYVGCTTVKNKIEDWFTSLAQQRPVKALYQKCGMDRPDNIAVNLMGQVTTCQNTAAEGKHVLGTVDDYDNIRLTTAHHHQTRDECRNCPVVQLCKGACLFLEGKYWKAACDVSFTYNLAMLAIALHYLTGEALIKIEADDGEFIRRPDMTEMNVLDIQGPVNAAA